jgi:hypothetical protein
MVSLQRADDALQVELSRENVDGMDVRSTQRRRDAEIHFKLRRMGAGVVRQAERREMKLGWLHA